MIRAVQVDLASPIPPYEQIRSQLASLIATGALTAGMRLPTVRDLAADLGVAVGTVRRAYTELEGAGLVVSRRRTGTVVAQGTTGSTGSTQLHAAIAHVAALARAEHLPEATVLALMRAALRAR